MEGYALVELGLKPLEFRRLTLSEFMQMLKLQREQKKQEYIRRAELVTIVINACGMNLKKGVEVKDLLGFDPYKKATEPITKETAAEDLAILKQKLGGESSGR